MNLCDPLLLTILSSDGKRIHEQVLPDRMEHALEIDLLHYTSGLYYVHLSSGSAWLAGVKLMVE